VRNVRIDTSLISQFSQAQAQSDDGAGRDGQPAGRAVLSGIDHDLHPRLVVPGGRCGNLDGI